MQSEYDKFATDFSNSRNYIWPEFNFIYDKIKKIKNKNILDIGCGNSRLHNFLLQKNITHKYIGIDISKNMIEISKKKYPYNTYINMDFDKVNIKTICDNNIIISIATIHHFLTYKKQLNILKKIKEINPDIFIFTVWNLLSDYCRKKYNINKTQSNTVINIPFGKYKYPRKYFIFTIDYLQNILDNAGFTKYNIQYYNNKDINTSKNIIIDIVK